MSIFSYEKTLNTANNAGIKSFSTLAKGYYTENVNLRYPDDIFGEIGTSGQITNGNSAYANSYTAFIISVQQDSVLGEISKDEGYFGVNQAPFGSGYKGSTLESLTKNGQSTLAKNSNTIATTATAVTGALGVMYSVAKGTSANNLVKKAGATALITGLINATGVATTKQGKRTQKACIVLPTPNLTSSYNLSWDQTNSAILSGVVDLLSSNSKLKEGEREADGFITKALDNASSGKNIESKVSGIQQAAQAAIMGSTGELGKQLSLLNRTAVNPRKEQRFNEVGFRSFSFSYIFAPTTEQEAKNIEAIIQMFKYHAHPDMPSGEFTMVYPSEFDIIHFVNGEENTHLPKHVTSVLKSISVDYTGGTGTYTFFHDSNGKSTGMPTLIKMDLNFEEMSFLAKSDIAKGY